MISVYLLLDSPAGRLVSDYCVKDRPSRQTQNSFERTLPVKDIKLDSRKRGADVAEYKSRILNIKKFSKLLIFSSLKQIESVIRR